MGHWGLLVSYAALPWAAGAALDPRLAGPARSAAWSCSWPSRPPEAPAGGLIAAAVALCMAASLPWPRPGVARRAKLVAGVAWW